MISFSIASSDGKSELACYRTECGSPLAMVQISHGMCEYIGRYEAFAEFLTENGFLVFGHDHIGHGHTAPTPSDLGFTAEGGGADFLVEDVHNLALKMKQEYPGVPLILFGHSMGSFIAREVLARYGSTYSAAILSGTGGPETPAGFGKLVASFLMAFRGERYRSKWLRGVAFAGYNKKFEKGCPENAWLSHDNEILARYSADPMCNYTFTLRAYHDLFTLVGWVSEKDWASRLPKDLPVLLVSGDMDPVGNWGKGPTAVAERMKNAGMTNVTLRLYHDMRHELLNDTDRETVKKEILQWLEPCKQSKN